MNPLNLLWIVPVAGAFGMAIHAVLVAGKEGDDEDPELIGKWLRVDPGVTLGTDKYICSECREEPWWCGVTEDVLPKYCPNCGAPMRPFVSDE